MHRFGKLSSAVFLIAQIFLVALVRPSWQKTIFNVIKSLTGCEVYKFTSSWKLCYFYFPASKPVFFPQIIFTFSCAGALSLPIFSYTPQQSSYLVLSFPFVSYVSSQIDSLF